MTKSGGVIVHRTGHCLLRATWFSIDDIVERWDFRGRLPKAGCSNLVQLIEVLHAPVNQVTKG